MIYLALFLVVLNLIAADYTWSGRWLMIKR
jgi:hypothetical protein